MSLMPIIVGIILIAVIVIIAGKCISMHMEYTAKRIAIYFFDAISALLIFFIIPNWIGQEEIDFENDYRIIFIILEQIHLSYSEFIFGLIFINMFILLWKLCDIRDKNLIKGFYRFSMLFNIVYILFFVGRVSLPM